VLAPIMDLATLLLLRARRRRSAAAAAFTGVLTGTGPHIYLAGWIAAAGLFGLALWPAEDRAPKAARLRLAGLFLAGFLLAVAPLFLFRKGLAVPYFARPSQQNVFVEIRYWRSLMPPFEAAADGIAAPWFIPEPSDLPGKTRLGWILGIPVAVSFLVALRQPRRELSALLLGHGAAAIFRRRRGASRGSQRLSVCLSDERHRRCRRRRSSLAPSARPKTMEAVGGNRARRNPQYRRGTRGSRHAPEMGGEPRQL